MPTAYEVQAFRGKQSERFATCTDGITTRVQVGYMAQLGNPVRKSHGNGLNGLLAGTGSERKRRTAQ